MGVDAVSTASFDSTADKKAVKSKTKRATKDEVAAKRVAELAKLKGADLTLLSVAKRAAIAAKIGKLEAQIKVDELSRQLPRSKSSSPGSGASNVTRSQFSDEEVT